VAVDATPTHIAHVTHNCLGLTAATLLTRMNGHQICPTSIH